MDWSGRTLVRTVSSLERRVFWEGGGMANLSRRKLPSCIFCARGASVRSSCGTLAPFLCPSNVYLWPYTIVTSTTSVGRAEGRQLTPEDTMGNIFACTTQ